MERIISLIMVLILVFLLILNFETRINKLETRLDSLAGVVQGLEREVEP